MARTIFGGLFILIGLVIWWGLDDLTTASIWMVGGMVTLLLKDR